MYDSQIRKYESGNTTPRTETLQTIASALNVPVSDLLNETEILEHRKKLEKNIKNADTEEEHTQLQNEHFTEGEKLRAIEEARREQIIEHFHSASPEGQQRIAEYAAYIGNDEKYNWKIARKKQIKEIEQTQEDN